MKEFTIFNRTFQFLTEERQWIKLQDYLDQYLFHNTYAKYAVIVLFAVLLGFLFSLALRGAAKKVCNFLTFLAYVGAMVLLFIFCRETARGFRVFSVSDYLTATGYHETRILISLINGLLFVPFGILLRKAIGRGYAIINVFLIFMIAAGIEIAQYVFSRGYSSLEDVLVYVVGGFVGLLIAAPFCRIAEYMEDKKKSRHRAGGRSKSRRYNRRDDRSDDDRDDDRYEDDDYDDDDYE